MIFRSDYSVADAVNYSALPDDVRELCEKYLADRMETAFDEGYEQGRSEGVEAGKKVGYEAGKRSSDKGGISK